MRILNYFDFKRRAESVNEFTSILKRKRASFTFYIICIILFLNGCTTPEKVHDNPEQAFAAAEEYEKASTYEMAIKKYQEVKNKFPYSQYAIRAEIAVADVYFKSEAFPEAQVHYSTFRDLHPNHPQMDYITYQLAMSFYKQLPSTIDRDLTLATDGIKYFDEVIFKFSKSKYVTDASQNRDAILKMLISKEEYIADFYFKRENYLSALLRYEGIMNQFKDSSKVAKALARASYAALKIGEKEKAMNYKEELLKRFPDSEYVPFTKKEVNL